MGQGASGQQEQADGNGREKVDRDGVGQFCRDGGPPTLDLDQVQRKQGREAEAGQDQDGRGQVQAQGEAGLGVAPGDGEPRQPHDRGEKADRKIVQAGQDGVWHERGTSVTSDGAVA
jgi:hypothetical protein